MLKICRARRSLAVVHNLCAVGHLSRWPVDNLGEIKRSGSNFIDSKIDVTTTLQTFALIVTAEPHFLMKIPVAWSCSRIFPPKPGNARSKLPTSIHGNSSDYFVAGVPDIADRDYRERPCRYSARDNRSTWRALLEEIRMLRTN